MKIALLILILVLLALIAYVRFKPINTAPYLGDPAEIGKAGNPGGYFVAIEGGDAISPAFRRDRAELNAALHTILRDMGGKRLDDGALPYALYEFRSRIFGFPDYLSLSIVTDENGKARPIIYSRLHYGKSDIGVNQARIEAILSQIEDEKP